MQTEPVKLSECGPRWQVDTDYSVDIAPGDYLEVCFGQMAGTPEAAFEHPNIAARSKRVHEFKHYHRNGSKSWTAKAGVDLWFIVPRSAVMLLPEKGYSWVPATINGVKVSFNVSGGTSDVGWSDWLRTNVHVSVGHSRRDLERVAAVALSGTAIELPPMDEGDEKRWQALYAERVIPAKITQGATVKLREGCTIDGETAVGTVAEVSFQTRLQWRKTDAGEEIGEHKPTSKIKGLILAARGFRVRAKLSDIDWLATAQLNGLAV
jgi:hypothetical protein